MEEAPLILLLFHLPIILRCPCFHAIYPNTLSRFPSNKIPLLSGPACWPVWSCVKAWLIQADPTLFQPTGPKKNCTCSASSCLTWQG